jgi:small subunit ribosomal protein S3Ae
MAVGKTQKKPGAKKGGKKKQADPFLKKEWYTVKSPSMFSTRTCGRTLVTKTQGTKLASDGLKGRCLTLSLGDLNQETDQAFRKFRLEILDVQGRNCLTNFNGMSITRDKLGSLIKKWQTTIECHTDVKTTDGYVLRVFTIAFTKRHPQQLKRHTYAQSTQIKRIRKAMNDIVLKEVGTAELKDVVNKLIPDAIGKDITKRCSSIYPVDNCLVRKVKVVKKPKFDVGKLMELYSEGTGGTTAAVGDRVDRPDNFEPPVLASV